MIRESSELSTHVAIWKKGEFIFAYHSVQFSI
jgi:hypothetical protein